MNTIVRLMESGTSGVPGVHAVESAVAVKRQDREVALPQCTEAKIVRDLLKNLEKCVVLVELLMSA